MAEWEERREVIVEETGSVLETVPLVELSRRSSGACCATTNVFGRARCVSKVMRPFCVLQIETVEIDWPRALHIRQPVSTNSTEETAIC